MLIKTAQNSAIARAACADFPAKNMIMLARKGPKQQIKRGVFDGIISPGVSDTGVTSSMESEGDPFIDTT